MAGSGVGAGVGRGSAPRTGRSSRRGSGGTAADGDPICAAPLSAGSRKPWAPADSSREPIRASTSTAAAIEISMSGHRLLDRSAARPSAGRRRVIAAPRRPRHGPRSSDAVAVTGIAIAVVASRSASGSSSPWPLGRVGAATTPARPLRVHRPSAAARRGPEPERVRARRSGRPPARPNSARRTPGRAPGAAVETAGASERGGGDRGREASRSAAAAGRSGRGRRSSRGRTRRRQVRRVRHAAAPERGRRASRSPSPAR